MPSLLAANFMLPIRSDVPVGVPRRACQNDSGHQNLASLARSAMRSPPPGLLAGGFGDKAVL